MLLQSNSYASSTITLVQKEVHF